MTRTSVRFRLFIIGGVIACISLILIGRLFILQVVQGSKFRNNAERQYVSSDASAFDRGDIFMKKRDGSLVALATLASGFRIAIVPDKIIDPDGVYEALLPHLPSLSYETFMSYVDKKGDPYEEIANRVSEEAGEKIANQKMKGVVVERQRWRIYPGGALASQTVGLIGYGDDGKTVVGKYGLERYYDDTLERGNTSLYVNFFAEVFTRLGKLVFDSEKEDEGNVEISIEPNVEAYLEDILLDVERKWNGKLTGGIIMDPKTGEILGMASLPTYNPNDISNVKVSTLGNPLVENVYEFGSIMKPLTMAMGIDTGVITPASTYDDTGTIVVDGRKISNFDKRARGPLTTMQEVLNQSLNVGSAYVMMRTGKEAFRNYFLSLGFGEETGIDLLGEVKGIIDSVESPRMVEYVTASFGQGFAATPIQMTRALGTLASHGVLVQPHIGTRITYDIGLPKTLGWGLTKQVYSKETTEKVSRMLVTAVDTALVGGTLKIPSMSVAAKTGTAQIPKPGGGYYDDRVLHSFFGYFPAYDPEFIIFLFTVEPVGAPYASDTLTKPFMNLVSYLTNYYEVTPDRAYEKLP